MTDKIVDLQQFREEEQPHRTGELICVACHHRGIHVWPTAVLLKNLECGICGKIGTMISTGQPVDDYAVAGGNDG